MRAAERPCEGDHGRRSVAISPPVDPAGNHDYSSPGAYFVTLCAHSRERLFGEIVDDEMRPNQFGRIVQSAWEGLARHYPDVELDAFVVMPNHVHGIVVILANDVAEANPIDLDVTGRLWGHTDRARTGNSGTAPTGQPGRTNRPGKLRCAATSSDVGATHLRPPQNDDGQIDQPRAWNARGGGLATRFYEHIVRDESRLLRFRGYILANPSRLAKDPENVSLTGR